MSDDATRSQSGSRAARSTYLPLSGLILLDHACHVVNKAFGCHAYLVGSCLTSADYRDVDVRSILADDEFDDLFGSRPTLWPLVCLAVSEYLGRVSQLPVDYQIQGQTEANTFEGVRNPLGMRRDYAGYVNRVMSDE